MASDYTSDTIDFTYCMIGSVQITWTGNSASNGEIYLESSLYDDDDWFDEIIGSAVTLSASGTGRGKKKTVLWSHESMGFRFVRVQYLKGSNTTGTFTIKAAGKSARW